MGITERSSSDPTEQKQATTPSERLRRTRPINGSQNSSIEQATVNQQHRRRDRVVMAQARNQKQNVQNNCLESLYHGARCTGAMDTGSWVLGRSGKGYLNLLYIVMGESYCEWVDGLEMIMILRRLFSILRVNPIVLESSKERGEGLQALHVIVPAKVLLGLGPRQNLPSIPSRSLQPQALNCTCYDALTIAESAWSEGPQLIEQTLPSKYPCNYTSSARGRGCRLDKSGEQG
jgi:hypothetical protein